jgi:hypothetical protein
MCADRHHLSGSCHPALAGGIGELSMIQVDGGLCRLRLGPTPAPAASNGDRDAPSRSRAHLPKAEKRCRTATPWPIALCSAPLVGFLNQAVMTASEEEREQILSTPSRRDVIRSQKRKWVGC